MTPFQKIKSYIPHTFFNSPKICVPVLVQTPLLSDILVGEPVSILKSFTLYAAALFIVKSWMGPANQLRYKIAGGLSDAKRRNVTPVKKTWRSLPRRCTRALIGSRVTLLFVWNGRFKLGQHPYKFLTSISFVWCFIANVQWVVRHRATCNIFFL